MRHYLLTFGLLLAGTSLRAQAPAGRPLSLYEKILPKFRADTSFNPVRILPPPDLDKLRWLASTWTSTAHVFATPTTPEFSRKDSRTVTVALQKNFMLVSNNEDDPTDKSVSPMLFYERYLKQWVAGGLDRIGYGIMTSTGWQQNQLVFTGSIVIMGEPTQLRQTWTRRSDTVWHLLNEEHLPDGSWVKLDEYTRTKVH